MALIKIIDKDKKITTGPFVGYVIEPSLDGLILEIYFFNETISHKYKLLTDFDTIEESNMKNYITEKFDNALNNNKTIIIDEFYSHEMIAIGDSETSRQFRAEEIE